MSRVFAQELDLTSVSEKFLARFWSKVDVRSPEECWEWQASRTGHGYGQFCLRRNAAFGERNGAKLTEADVREILSAPARYGITEQLGRQYGVAGNTIRAIRARRKWKHIDEVAS
jgi:hypothetical protein